MVWTDVRLALTWRVDFGLGVLFKVPFRAPETLAGWAAVVGEDSARAAARVQPQRLQKGPDRGLLGLAALFRK